MLEPLLLPGQSAAPPGPADMTMMYVLHHAFRRDVRDVRRTVASLELDDRERWRLLADRWDFFVGELHQHHTKEDDILWPPLLERVRAAGDVESEQVLEEMEAEHAVLDPLLAAASAAMARLAREAHPQARAVLPDRQCRGSGGRCEDEPPTRRAIDVPHSPDAAGLGCRAERSG